MFTVTIKDILQYLSAGVVLMAHPASHAHDSSSLAKFGSVLWPNLGVEY